MRLRYIFLAFSLWVGCAYAVEPDEILADPALEARARVISKDLRCLVCQNESIDESNASLARDLRLLVRERLVMGESNEEVLDFVVTRYGEFALLRPQTKGTNVILWVAGPVMLLLALLIAFAYIKSRQAQVNSAASNALSVVEKERLDKILERTNLE